jgi:Ti-type conjugative transfer relaxase TraA
LAIYHLTAKVISRARGQSIAAAAAYRSGSMLRDERYGLTHNYTRDRPAAHTEIMSPPGAPAWVQHRETLWNRVEAAERRKDAQLARAIEIGLPVELSATETVALVRDYIAQEFVSKGMIADFSIRLNGANNPQVHILLTLREAAASGFGPKMRHWNRKSNLMEWRSAWAERANQHLARAGHVVRIDHRTLEAQQSELMPGRNVGIGSAARGRRSLPSHIEARVAEQQRIAKENGEMILEDPTVALRALCRQRPTFTHQELVQFLKTRTHDPAQQDAALAAIMQSSELIALDAVGAAPARFTSRDLLEAEKSLMKRVAAMAVRRGRAAPAPPGTAELQPLSLTEEQRDALGYLVGVGDIKALASSAAGGKGPLLAAARGLWELQGLTVVGVALSTLAAASLQAASGINSQTLASQELAWEEGRSPATPNHVIVVDGAEMIGLKQLERVLAVADKARGKLVLVGDPEQLEAMGATSPLQNVLDKIALLTAAALRHTVSL